MADRFPPPNACDSHVHVIGPKDRFPLPRERAYTPMDATAAELAAMLNRLKLDRVVLVQPSFYRTDNACMLDAMAAIPNSRGVAVLPATVPDSELADLHKRGVRGLRVNIATFGKAAIEDIAAQIKPAAALCERNGWHLQIFIEANAIEPLAPLLLSLGVDVVVDHFGLIAPGTTSEPLTTLCRMLETGKVWVKISGAYRISGDPADRRIDPMAKQLCKANPARVVWGSDWPHTPKHAVKEDLSKELPFQKIDTKGLLDLLPRWLGDDDAVISRVLVDNPAVLYDF